VHLPLRSRCCPCGILCRAVSSSTGRSPHPNPLPQRGEGVWNNGRHAHPRRCGGIPLQSAQPSACCMLASHLAISTCTRGLSALSSQLFPPFSFELTFLSPLSYELSALSDQRCADQPSSPAAAISRMKYGISQRDLFNLNELLQVPPPMGG